MKILFPTQNFFLNNYPLILLSLFITNMLGLLASIILRMIYTVPNRAEFSTNLYLLDVFMFVCTIVSITLIIIISYIYLTLHTNNSKLVRKSSNYVYFFGTITIVTIMLALFRFCVIYLPNKLCVIVSFSLVMASSSVFAAMLLINFSRSLLCIRTLRPKSVIKDLPSFVISRDNSLKIFMFSLLFFIIADSFYIYGLITFVQGYENIIVLANFFAGKFCILSYICLISAISTHYPKRAKFLIFISVFFGHLLWSNPIHCSSSDDTNRALPEENKAANNQEPDYYILKQRSQAVKRR